MRSHLITPLEDESQVHTKIIEHEQRLGSREITAGIARGHPDTHSNNNRESGPHNVVVLRGSEGMQTLAIGGNNTKRVKDLEQGIREKEKNPPRSRFYQTILSTNSDPPIFLPPLSDSPWRLVLNRYRRPCQAITAGVLYPPGSPLLRTAQASRAWSVRFA